MAQASSVPCERLFSASKQMADYRRSRLSSDKFEQLQIMKFSWCLNIMSYASYNSGQVEECNLEEYQDLLKAEFVTDQLEAGLEALFL